MTSTKTLMPVDYYRLPFCQPPGGPKHDSENLGEFLAGDRIESSPYRLFMKKDMYCEQVCSSNLGRSEQRGVSPNKVVKAIRRGYHNNWIVDNLPAASKVEDAENMSTRYWQGFPIGFVADDTKKAYINNHVNIEIMYHPVETGDGYRVVRFTVEPFSIKHDFEPLPSAKEETEDDFDDESFVPKVATIKNPIPSCDPANTAKDHTSYDMVNDYDHSYQEASGKVLFTYDVIWIENKELKWASRWDVYLTMDNAVPAKVHWLSIANSLVIVFVLSAMIVAILVRNLARDINRYNKVPMDEEARAEELEEYGWKLVHSDVFRPPARPMLLSVACGTGAQLLCMTLFTIFFSALGFMNPARRGHLLMGLLLFYVALGSVNGYVTARLYKTFKGKAWQRATATAALLMPGITFALFFLMNIVALIKGSTDAVPFLTMVILVVLWMGISTPLVFLGAYFGYKQDAIEYPVSIGNIPRQIPDQPWFMGVPFTMAIGGILPFGSCFVELYFIMSSVWMEYYYYVFGFLLLVFLILLITCAEITVLYTYFQLCSEDYHWWWRSFCNAGSTAIYVFLYSWVYFKQLEANTLATYVLYFGYMGLVSLGLFMMMGFVGLSTSLLFNKAIFSSIKID
jgi:transmembrane 9 superfamily protein 2/4